MTRKIAFEEIQNFRDFGGYEARGQRLARGRLYRSASHALASDVDLDRLAGMGISAIVDLRRPEERERGPSRRWRDCAAVVIENDDPHEGEESWRDLLTHSDLSVEAFRGYLVRYYTRGPHLPRHIDLFTRYFDTLAKLDGALVVHCAAGKDRTGMIVALTHTLAGVHRDDIFEDFLLTNDPERFDAHGPLWAEAIKAEHGRAPDRAAMHVAMGVDAAYLAATFASIEERYGDVETYLRDVLKIDAAKRAAIERRLFD